MTEPTVAEFLQPLRNAIATGDTERILSALPEPPFFLPALLSLAPADRSYIVNGLFPTLDGDEDRWELIEASAMDTIANPERGAWEAIVPLIPPSLVGDARLLVASVRGPKRRAAMEQTLLLSSL